MCPGRKACHNSGLYGSAKTAVTVEHSFLKMAIYPKNFNKNGRKHIWTDKIDKLKDEIKRVNY